MAECHPVGFQWLMEARARGAKVIHVDPRFTRTSAHAHLHAPIRAGSDIAFLGGIVNYILSGGREFRDYVTAYTNAAMIVNEDFVGPKDLDGLFAGRRPMRRCSTRDACSSYSSGTTAATPPSSSRRWPRRGYPQHPDGELCLTPTPGTTACHWQGRGAPAARRRSPPTPTPTPGPPHRDPAGQCRRRGHRLPQRPGRAAGVGGCHPGRSGRSVPPGRGDHAGPARGDPGLAGHRGREHADQGRLGVGDHPR
jgi:anaerobic selenocysteine-containing dehydrogenase